MIVYIGKYNLKIEGIFIDKEIESEKKRYGIISVLPVFDEEQKAKEFCGERGYLIMARD